MTELNLIQFDINLYYINRYINRLYFITYIYIYIICNINGSKSFKFTIFANDIILLIDDHAIDKLIFNIMYHDEYHVTQCMCVVNSNLYFK